MISTSHASELPVSSSTHTALGGFVMTAVDADCWDRAVSGFDGICQEQLYAYAARRWPGVTIEPRLFSHGGDVVGGALVMVQKLPLGLASVALCKWGPFLADGASDASGRIMAGMVDAMIAEYADRRGMMVSIMPKVERGADNRVARMLEARGFSAGVGVKYPLRYVVDVTLDDDARMAAFGQKWRYNLRKAFKAGLGFEHGTPQDLERFMTLYRAMSERKMFPDYSGIDTVDGLMAMPDGTARPELFFVTHAGETVAGAMIFTAGDTACYLYGATNDAALDLRAGYFLHWHIIRWLRENTGAMLYDLGGTDGFAGLQQFKSGMVGDAGHISPLPPVYNFAMRARARAAGTFAYKAREWLTRGRDRVTVLKLAAMRRMGRR